MPKRNINQVLVEPQLGIRPNKSRKYEEKEKKKKNIYSLSDDSINSILEFAGPRNLNIRECSRKTKGYLYHCSFFKKKMVLRLNLTNISEDGEPLLFAQTKVCTTADKFIKIVSSFLAHHNIKAKLNFHARYKYSIELRDEKHYFILSKSDRRRGSLRFDLNRINFDVILYYWRNGHKKLPRTAKMYKLDEKKFFGKVWKDRINRWGSKENLEVIDKVITEEYGYLTIIENRK